MAACTVCSLKMISQHTNCSLVNSNAFSSLTEEISEKLKRLLREAKEW